MRFPLGLRPRPRWGAYSAPPDLLAVLKGLLLRGGRGRAAPAPELEAKGGQDKFWRGTNKIWRAREREPITGVWRQSPQRGPGAEPLVRGSGGRSPPEAKLKAFLLLDVS